VRGYDELVPKTLDVVQEKRLYKAFPPNFSKPSVGITAVKAKLNQLHAKMTTENFVEIHVHQEANTITVQRHNPVTHEAYYLIAHTAFSNLYENGVIPAPSVRIPGVVSETLFVSRLIVPPQHSANKHVPDSEIAGLEAVLLLEEGLPRRATEGSQLVQVEMREGFDKVFYFSQC
jgi:hypothetical protein